MLHGKKIQVILKLYDKMKTFLFGKKAFFQFNGLIVVALINCTSPFIFSYYANIFHYFFGPKNSYYFAFFGYLFDASYISFGYILSSLPK